MNDQKVTSNTEVTDKLKILEQDKIFNELDFLISEKEILQSLKELKNKKNQAVVIQFLMKC